jgi:hypothetical protein
MADLQGRLRPHARHTRRHHRSAGRRCRHLKRRGN